MSLASNARVPELVAGVDVRTLPLSALEGFVLSRIDGRSTVGDIVSLTGLGADQVSAILDKLVALGAARYRDEPQGPSTAAGVGRRADSHAPSGSQPPRRRSSYGPSAHPPRRMLAESGVSSAAPDAPPSSRPRSHSEPSLFAAGASPSQRPPAPDARTDAPPVKPPPSRPASMAPSFAPSAPIAPPPTPSLAPSGVPEPAKYDPRELDEDVDLPRERRKQILDLFYQLPSYDYYEALGISYKADKKEIRSAYFALSKTFHPDTMFRKNLGSYKTKMEQVFQLLTEAYETLGKKKARDEYDAYLRSTKAVRMAERALSFDAAQEAARASVEQVPPPPPVPNIPAPSAASSLPPVPAPQREVSAEARKLAQEVIARRLRGVGTMAPRPPTVVPEQASATPAAGPKTATDGPKTGTHELLARLTRTLRDVGQLTGSNDMVTRAVRASQAAVDRGDLTEATQQAARAASLAPERSELKVEHDRLSGMLSRQLADDYIARAKFEMKQGKWASAALTWSKVCEGRPDDAVAHRMAANALLKGGGELRSAQRYAQKAVFLAPNDIEARILLAQLYLTVGLKLNARRELDAAAKLDPANEMVKNLLADLEKG